MTQRMNIAADDTFAFDLSLIVWARNMTVLALSQGLQQDRAKPETVSYAIQVVELVAKKLDEGKAVDAQLLGGFIMSAWGLLDLADHWRTLPDLVAKAKARGLVMPDDTQRLTLTEQLGSIMDELDANPHLEVRVKE